MIKDALKRKRKRVFFNGCKIKTKKWEWREESHVS